MMLLMRWWEIFAKIRNLMIYGSGVTDVNVLSPRKYINVIFILASHTFIFMRTLVVLMNTLVLVISLFLPLHSTLGFLIKTKSLEMGGEPRK